MTKATLDSTLLARLPALTEQVEFCNSAGEPLGVFLPTADFERLMYAWAHAHFDDEEIERSRQEGGEHTLAEILASFPRE